MKQPTTEGTGPSKPVMLRLDWPLFRALLKEATGRGQPVSSYCKHILARRKGKG